MKKVLFFILVCSWTLVFGQNIQDSLFISANSGWYQEPFELIFSNADSTDVFYSTDGTYPNKKFRNNLIISETTSIRLRKKNSKKEYIRNYLFLNRKVTLPAVCITTNPSNLFDSAIGIYTKGPGASSIPPYKGANFHKNWERKAIIEVIDTAGKIEISQSAGIKIFGQYSAMLPQKSISIHARKKYGNKKFRYPLFPDLPCKNYKSFILRNSGSDYCNTHIRDVMMTSLVKGLNFDVQAYRPSIVFINGKYWGIYHIREKINEHFIKQHYKVDKDSIAILKHRGDVQQYGRINYKSVLKFINKSDFSMNQNIDSLNKLIDIDNYLDYNIAQVYFNNIDAGGNIRYWRHRKDGSKWRWILFDTDFGFGLRKGNDVDENTLKRFTSFNKEKWPSPPWSTLIIRKLLENDSISKLYISKLTLCLNTIFQPKNVTKHICEIENRLKYEMPYHFERWNRRISTWEKNMKTIIDFGERRADFIRNHTMLKFAIDSFYSVAVSHNFGGEVFMEGSKIDSNHTGIYFTNHNYKISVKPNFGYSYEVSKGNGGHQISNSILKIMDSANVKITFIKNGNSIFSGKVKINEIVVNDTIYSDVVEFFNGTDSEINLSGWVLRLDGKTNYIFPEGTTIEANSFLSICKDSIINNEVNGYNIVSGLFNLKKNTFIELYSNLEELVDSLQLNKKMFKGKASIEMVSSLLKEGWTKSDTPSVNKENLNQTEKILESKIMIGSIIIMGLFLLLLVIRFIFVKRKRLRGATE